MNVTQRVQGVEEEYRKFISKRAKLPTVLHIWVSTHGLYPAPPGFNYSKPYNFREINTSNLRMEDGWLLIWELQSETIFGAEHE